jgi:uncharacterized membrane protein YhaH (DUF805 family)
MTVGSFAAMFPVMQSMMSAAAEAAEAGGNSAFPRFGTFFIGIAIMTAIAVFLYAAAVARRLHDGGLSGLWGLMPLPFLAFSMVRMREFFVTSFGSNQFDMNRFSQVFVSNFIYILTLIALIVLLARRSDPGPNRYDEGG